MTRNHLISHWFVRVVLVLFALALAAGWAGSLAHAASSDPKIDAVLAMDASTSMNDSDKNKVANEAMKMFIDMASVQGDKIGLLSYTDQIVREKAMLKIQSLQDKESLKTFIDQLARGPYTDIAVGVSEAMKVLEAGKESGHYPLVVLLTDGNNSLPKGRTKEQSDAELKQAVEKAKKQGVPIYTIGLNADGQLNKAVLEQISNETGGKSFETSTAATLPQILSEIFADHLKLKVVPLTSLTANGDFQDVKVSVPNANVLEANISIMSGKPVEVKLFDPSGNEQKIPSDTVVYAKSNAYSLVKLMKPVQGDWLLKVKGVQQDQININLVYNYDLSLVMEPIAATIAVGDNVSVRAHLVSNGQQVTDADVYKSMQGKLVLTDTDTKQTKDIPLTNNGNSFSGTFQVADAHHYTALVVAEDANLVRESAPVTFEGTAKGAAKPTPVQPEETEPKKPFPWLYVIGGIVLLLLLAAIALFLLSKVKQANKGFYGQVVIEIRDEDTGERMSPQYKKLHAFKGKVKLHQLLQLAPEFAETDKIILTPGSDSIYMTNQSGCVIEKSGRAFDASKPKELKNNDRIKITLQNVNKSIWLDYII